jgi:hypothetical protein
MNATTTTAAALSKRDIAVLRAVAAGRCQISETFGGNLVIDGLWFTDQFAGPRLTEAGLISPDSRGGPARLTGSGRALLEAA